MESKIIVSFRGSKVEIPLKDCVSVGQVRSRVADASKHSLNPIRSDDVKLIFKGKVLSGHETNLVDVLIAGKPKKTAYRLVAMGVSQAESANMEQEYRESVRKNTIVVRDDLTEDGRRKMKERQQLGRKLMNKANISKSSTSANGFGRIETLPNIPDEAKAREILSTLANDSGIKACMEKHKWRVGSLSELYPEGKVGKSEVCVMGLNRNKGQQILLRIRTDDLKGFRKMLSIREVLYHELAHNVHSEHDDNFFRLMRQIKKECLEMDWTKGSGTIDVDKDDTSYTKGGTYLLGGKKDETGLTTRVLAARAAVLRLSTEEEEVKRSCGCGHGKILFDSAGESRHRDDGSRVDES
jgi:hypothetical protein